MAVSALEILGKNQTSEFGCNVMKATFRDSPKTRAGPAALSHGRYSLAAQGVDGEPGVRHSTGSRGNRQAGGHGLQAQGEHSSYNPRALGKSLSHGLLVPTSFLYPVL